MKKKDVEMKTKNCNSKANGKWDKLSKSKRYQATALCGFSQDIVEQMKEEFLDGASMVFDERNQQKGNGYKRRLLRRIAEKRYAQLVYHKFGEGNERFLSCLSKRFCSECLNDVQRHRYAS